MLGPPPTASVGSCRDLLCAGLQRASPRPSHLPFGADETGRERELRRAIAAPAAPRTIAAVLAMLPSVQSPAATYTVRQTARAPALPVYGVDDVVMGCTLVHPAAHGDARGGEPSVRDRHRLPRRIRAGHGDPRLRGCATRPAGASTGSCDVAAERDEHTAAGGLVRHASRTVRRPGLGGRAEVELARPAARARCRGRGRARSCASLRARVRGWCSAPRPGARPLASLRSSMSSQSRS